MSSPPPGVEANLTYCAINPGEDAPTSFLEHLTISVLAISEMQRTPKKIAAETVVVDRARF